MTPVTRATAAGRKVLAAARQRLQELVAEVLEDHDEPFQAIKQKRHERQGPRSRARR